jgi:peptidoglycan hydrolase FlgJ
MSDNKTMGIDSALFQLQAANSGRALSSAQSSQGHDPSNTAELEAASRQFESLLLNIMIREMRATVSESDFFPSSMAQDIFTSMLDEQYADSMADSGGIGLHRLIIDQLKDVASDK